jgi:hypothetical protein
MGTKCCNKCKVDKSLDEFHIRKKSKDGKRNTCKSCIIEYSKLYNQNNKDKIKISCKKWRNNNKQKSKEIIDNWKFNNKERYNKLSNDWKNKNPEYDKNYYKNNKEKCKNYSIKWANNKYKTDPLFKLKTNIRVAINDSFKNINNGKFVKDKSISLILGCSYEEFKLYLESKFEPWMNWDNKGFPKDGIIEPNKTWDIDHIIPISSAKTKDELIKLNHYINFQPLCSYYNRFIKKDKL